MIDKDLLDFAISRYEIPLETLSSLTGGHFTQVYEFTRDGQVYVLRITPPDEQLDQQAARVILDWMAFLSEAGAAVPRPVPSKEGRLIETCPVDGGEAVLTVFKKAPGILAEALPFDRWDRGLFRALGAAAGRLHALARRCPPDLAARFPEWNQAQNCYHPQETLGPGEEAVLAARADVIGRLRYLPHDPSGWGLIHADLHGGNLLVEPDRRLFTILDFDDSCQGWFGMDIAMNILDMAVLYPGEDKDAFIQRFLERYLAGYLSESPLSPFWAAQIPRFLKLLETGLYIQVHDLYDPQDTTSWVGRYMQGRKRRIAAGKPFVEIDFVKLVHTLQSNL